MFLFAHMFVNLLNFHTCKPNDGSLIIIGLGLWIVDDYLLVVYVDYVLNINGLGEIRIKKNNTG